MQAIDKNTQKQKKDIDKIKSELKNRELKKKTANLVETKLINSEKKKRRKKIHGFTSI